MGDSYRSHQLIVEPGLYLHYKGNTYEVLFMAKHSETLEEHVVYRPVNSSQFWIRPLDMFSEKVIIDGKPVSRFKKL